ncbi:hypothetical protein [Corynebacterium halotolerans]|uniref:hypothetical protein n=1 Tax=Corynebacterium halotolerans TaxID=225326 RepID=UPI003CF4496B
MNENTLILPEWVASQVAAAGASGVDLRQLMEERLFTPSSVRTVAGSGDFQITEGRVHRRPTPGVTADTWLPAEDPAVAVHGGEYLVTIAVTGELLAGAGLIVPRSIAGMLEVPRWYHRALDSRLGKRVLQLSGTAARFSPIADFLLELDVREGDQVSLVFCRNGWFDVRRQDIE